MFLVGKEVRSNICYYLNLLIKNLSKLLQFELFKWIIREKPFPKAYINFIRWFYTVQLKMVFKMQTTFSTF